MAIDINYFKDKLIEEQKELEKELSTVGRINPNNPNDWEPVPEKMDTMKADKNELADAMEGYEENTAVLRELEIRLNNIKKAQKKIEEGTYGICDVDGKEIPEDRLKANPSATTCLEHTK